MISGAPKRSSSRAPHHAGGAVRIYEAMRTLKEIFSVSRFSAMCFLLLAFAALPARCASEMLRLDLGPVQVDYHPGDNRIARDAAAGVRHSAEAISGSLGISFSRPVAVALARGRDEFNRLCGGPMPAWALAAAIPERQGIVVDVANVTPATANDMGLAIFHEMAHLALGRAEAGRKEPLPRWFHEGVATWLSAQRHVRGDRSVFDLAAAGGKLIPLDRISTEFPQDAKQADLAYLESEEFVACLMRTCSPESLRWVLDRYRGGEPFEEAFRNALGESRREMEAAWAESLRSRIPWLRTLWRSLPFYGVLAILTILVYIAVRWRGWRQRRQWDEEERAWRAVLRENADGSESEDNDEEPEDDEDEELDHYYPPTR